MTLSRVLLIAAVVAGVSYIASWFLPLPAAAGIAWKGAGVGLLALYAASQAKGADGWLLAVVMAFGALGDVLLETHGLVTGALAFLAGHLTAIGLYLKNRRPLGAADWAVAGALLVAIPVIAYLLPPQRAGAGLIALYAAGLSAMAAAAWLSRFPRALTAAGAIMFAVSDLLIFVRTGRPGLDILPMGLAVWGLYFGGQALIALGVTRTLAGRTS
ncbi:lysoplasmalogenase family protein [Phenylobacterium sp.]|uniref:lysoplasmalogenase family protein n=1 Tax=Phenylobacterium sp. TaxID=1871053 RepID=UPI0025D9843C|nr:lysoplasmalogenase family protein [Phenylobacterium sp.]MBX3483876.1 lysoplasmalogenase [Phenylobacterium sp.]MCW5758330.1 lysoplasmalogenase [Phenylobacterium sp.]